MLLLSTAKKKRCRSCVFQKFNRDVFVCLPCRNFPPGKHALHNSEPLKAFELKVRTSAVIVVHSQ